MSTIALTPGRLRRGGAGLRRRIGLAGVVAALVVAVAAALALVGPLLASDDANVTSLSGAWLGPSGGHALGLDVQGRDVLSRLVAGARSSMLGPLVVVSICMSVGTLIAVVSAWRRGFVDTAMSAGLDILFAFPAILLAALTAAVFGPGLVAAALAISVAYTPYVARVLRGAMLRERNQLYIAALEVQGCPATSICLRHLIPNVVPLLVAQATILFGYAMLDLAVVSFLGLGVQPPTPDWGVMVAENQPGILQGFALPAVSAGLCIVAVVVSMNVLGERLLDQAERGRR